MSKDPAFLFYPGDWLGGTMGMTFEEKGAYLELLILQFHRGHMTSHMVGQIVGHLWDNIEDKFKKDGKGLYYNERLDLEKNKRKNYISTRRNNLLGSNQHTKNKESMRGRMTSHMTSHMENENENENKDRNRNNLFVAIKNSSVKKTDVADSGYQDIGHIGKSSIVPDDIGQKIEVIYKSYPTRCPIKKSSTGKNSKNKNQIRKLLGEKSFDDIVKIQELYIRDCSDSKTYLKNYTTFLNQFPDVDSFSSQFNQKEKTRDEEVQNTIAILKTGVV